MGLSARTAQSDPGVHEVIVTIMMNFIALYLSNVLVRNWLSTGADSTEKIPASASLRWGDLSSLFGGARIHIGIFIALATALFMYYLLWRTTSGFELRAVGFNPDASEYAGMSVKRSLILSMMISGTFAGLAGASELLGTSGYLAIHGSHTGIGFDGIAVALLGANSPVGILWQPPCSGFSPTAEATCNLWKVFLSRWYGWCLPRSFFCCSQYCPLGHSEVPEKGGE